MLNPLQGQLTMLCRLLLLVFVCHYWCTPTEARFIEKRAAQFYIANETMCIVDGDIYRNGDPVPTDDECERCTCRPPGFSCVLRDCDTKPGCKAVRKVGECCPEYVCGCVHNNRLYEDGELIKDLQNSCYTCRCHGSSISCIFADCHFRGDCQPEYIQGECCPRYDHCPPLTTTTTTTTPHPSQQQEQLQQEIDFVNFTTYHVERFTSEDTTVTIQDIAVTDKVTTTPSYETTVEPLFSVKFELSGEKISSIHEYDTTELTTLLPVQYTETTKLIYVPLGTEVSTLKEGLIVELSESSTTASNQHSISTETTAGEAESGSSEITYSASQYDTSTEKDSTATSAADELASAEPTENETDDIDEAESSLIDKNDAVDVKTSTMVGSEISDVKATTSYATDVTDGSTTFNIADVSSAETSPDSHIDSFTEISSASGKDGVELSSGDSTDISGTNFTTSLDIDEIKAATDNELSTGVTIDDISTSTEQAVFTDIDSHTSTLDVDDSKMEETTVAKVNTELDAEETSNEIEFKSQSTTKESTVSKEPILVTTSFNNEETSTFDPIRESLYNISSSSDTKFEGFGNLTLTDDQSAQHSPESFTSSDIDSKVTGEESTSADYEATSYSTLSHTRGDIKIDELEYEASKTTSNEYEKEEIVTTEAANQNESDEENENSPIHESVPSLHPHIPETYLFSTHIPSTESDTLEKVHETEQFGSSLLSTIDYDGLSSHDSDVFIASGESSSTQSAGGEKETLDPTDSTKLEVQESQDSESSQAPETASPGLELSTEASKTWSDAEEHSVSQLDSSSENSGINLETTSIDRSTTVRIPGLIEGDLETFEHTASGENLDRLNLNEIETKLDHSEIKPAVSTTAASDGHFSHEATAITSITEVETTKSNEIEHFEENVEELQSQAETIYGGFNSSTQSTPTESSAHSVSVDDESNLQFSTLSEEMKPEDYYSLQSTPEKIDELETKQGPTESHSVTDGTKSESDVDTYSTPSSEESYQQSGETEQDSGGLEVSIEHDGQPASTSHEDEQVSTSETDAAGDIWQKSTLQTDLEPHATAEDLVKIPYVYETTSDESLYTEQTFSSAEHQTEVVTGKTNDDDLSLKTQGTTIGSTVSIESNDIIEEKKTTSTLDENKLLHTDAIFTTQYVEFTTTTRPTTRENEVPPAMPNFEPPLANILKQPSIFDRPIEIPKQNLTSFEDHFPHSTASGLADEKPPPKLSLTLTEESTENSLLNEDLQDRNESNVFVLNHEYTISESEINGIEALDAEESFISFKESVNSTEEDISPDVVTEGNISNTTTAEESLLDTTLYSTEESVHSVSSEPAHTYLDDKKQFAFSPDETARNDTKPNNSSNDNADSEKLNLNFLPGIPNEIDQVPTTILNAEGDEDGDKLAVQPSSTTLTQSPESTNNTPDDSSTNAETSDDYFNHEDNWKLSEKTKLTHTLHSTSTEKSFSDYNNDISLTTDSKITSPDISIEVSDFTTKVEEIASSKEPEVTTVGSHGALDLDTKVAVEAISEASSIEDESQDNKYSEISEHEQDDKDDNAPSIKPDTEMIDFTHEHDENSLDNKTGDSTESNQDADYSYQDAEPTAMSLGDLHPDSVTTIHDISSALSSEGETYTTREPETSSEETDHQPTPSVADTHDERSTVKIDVFFGQNFFVSKFDGGRTSTTVLEEETETGERTENVSEASNQSITPASVLPEELHALDSEPINHATVEDNSDDSDFVHQQSSPENILSGEPALDESTTAPEESSSSFTILEHISDLFSTLTSLSSDSDYESGVEEKSTTQAPALQATNALDSSSLSSHILLTDQLSEYGYLGGVRITAQSKYNGSTLKEKEPAENEDKTTIDQTKMEESTSSNEFYNRGEISTSTVTIDQSERATEMSSSSNHVFSTSTQDQSDIEQTTQINEESFIKLGDTLKNEFDLDQSPSIENQGSLLRTGTTIREEGPEKGGDWFEPTDPSISLSNTESGQKEIQEILQESNEMSQQEIVEEHDTDSHKVELSQLPYKETNLEQTGNGEDNASAVNPPSTSEFETLTESQPMPGNVPPIPILLQNMNQEEISDDIFQEDESRSDSTVQPSTKKDTDSSYYESMQKGLIIPVQVLTTGRKLEQPTLHGGDIISKVFKAPGYDSEFHARSWKSPLPKNLRMRWRRDSRSHQDTPEQKDYTTAVPAFDYSVDHSTKEVPGYNGKNVLLVEGFHYKQSDFFPVTSSLIKVRSDEETEANEYRKNAKRKSAAEDEYENGSELANASHDSDKAQHFKKMIETK